jgi:hypothetical protein
MDYETYNFFCLPNSSILKTIKLGHVNAYCFSGPTYKIDWFSGCPRTFHCKLPLNIIVTIFVNLYTLAILKYIMVTIFFYRLVFNINPLISRWKDVVLSESMYRKIRQVFSAIFCSENKNNFENDTCYILCCHIMQKKTFILTVFFC